MLILKQGEVYFIDRDNEAFKVDGMTFPYFKNIAEHLTYTLLDGVSEKTA